MTDKRSYFSELSNIRQNETLFFALSEFSPAGIYLTDKDGDCLYVNKKWQEMAGLTGEEATGKGWKAALHTDDLDEIISQWYKVIETQGAWKFEYRFVNQKTNQITWLLGLAKPLYNNQGLLKGYLGLNIDISDEKKRVEDLKHSMQEELQDAHMQLEKLHGILPICASCKKIRAPDNNWKDIDKYIIEHTNADLSHGICPSCLQKLYPDFYS